MPIKPENRARYPKNWKAIRAGIIDRAGDRCEFCRVKNGKLIYRTGRWVYEADAHWIDSDTLAVHEAETGRRIDVLLRMSDIDENAKLVRVVLTIAHLDHVPEHCDPSNLRALCQRCHLRYDHQHHMANAKATRDAKRLAEHQSRGDLFA